jgi:hypothetical protein
MQLQKFCHRESASSGKYAVNKRIPGILCFISTLMLFLKLHKTLLHIIRYALQRLRSAEIAIPCIHLQIKETVSRDIGRQFFS